MTNVKKVPMRKCIGCGESKEKKDLIRIVKNKEGQIFLDKTGKQNGRGAYICLNRECLKKAIKTRGLNRAFKMEIPQEAYDELLIEMDKVDS